MSSVPPPPSTAVPFTYERLGYTPLTVPQQFRAYHANQPAPLADTGVRDADGVRMARIDGRLYDHPVAQAQYGLSMVESYRASGNRAYLDRAILQAERLLQTRVESRGAWYYPYRFDFALHGNPADLMTAPWYSAMAQGQVLSLFVRLAELTGDQGWRLAADATFASFLNGPQAGLPWTVHRDGSGYLWLEEYARDPDTTSDFTFNGHMFAVFGLYDYAMATGNTLAAQLWDGAVTTTRRYAQDGIPHAEWVSNYCLAHEVESKDYHHLHIQMLLLIESQTADSSFGVLSDTFRDDFPPPALSSTVHLPAGSVTGYTFTPTGAVSSTRTVVLSATSTAPSDVRTRISSRGIYYRITAGLLAGYYVQERAGAVFAHGGYLETLYYPIRPATVAVGTLTGYTFNGAGAVATSESASYGAQTEEHVERTAMWGGRRYALLLTGPLASLWVSVDDVALG
jgi:hypothetical protein